MYILTKGKLENQFPAGLPDRNNDTVLDGGVDTCGGDSGDMFFHSKDQLK